MSKYVWLTEMSQQFLNKDYLLEGDTVDKRVTAMARRAGITLEDPTFADRFIENMKKGWYSLSTPIWTNYATARGLPISCYGSSIEDTTESILGTLAEIGMMTKMGGGTSAFFGNLRGRGAEIKDNGVSSGSVHFISMFENIINVISQGRTRRGNVSPYLPIEHPDILEFLKIRHPGFHLQNVSPGITVSDKWFKSMLAGDLDKKAIWAKVMESRIATGYPYIMFADNVAKGRPDVYKDKKMEVTHSNLCSEIMLPDGPDESFVCDLASMNIVYYDDWKNTDAVQMLVYFLDAVMTEFIEKSEHIAYFERARNFAIRHRAIGIGWLGWHSYLQSKMIPFESMEAKMININVAKTIKEQAYEASRLLAHQFGEPELLKGYGRRNTTLTAIAPTKSSAFIIGQASEGIEPHRSNYFIKDLAKGKFTIRNTELTKLLEVKGMNTEEVWSSILQKNGSVQHLDFLNENEKAVFKTFVEISPKEILIQASGRQKHIDQSQSLNLMIPLDVPVKDLHQLLVFAWESGIKSLYYQIGVSAAQALARDINECVSCSS